MTTHARTGSKPEAVSALRATWRKSAEHAAEQFFRFLRLFALAAVTPVIDLIVKGSGHFDWYTLFVALVPVGEAAFRQVYPALGAAKADQAPGVTIVPAQVGSDPGTEDGLEPVPEPEQTDNSPRPEDPSATTPVSQDPNWVPSSDDVADDSGSVIA